MKNLNFILCEECAHQNICKHQAEFIKIQEHFNSLNICITIDKKLTTVPIENFDYIEVPQLKCKDFLDKVYASKRSVTE